jgi:hypothetical protein
MSGSASLYVSARTAVTGRSFVGRGITRRWRMDSAFEPGVRNQAMSRPCVTAHGRPTSAARAGPIPVHWMVRSRRSENNRTPIPSRTAIILGPIRRIRHARAGGPGHLTEIHHRLGCSEQSVNVLTNTTYQRDRIRATDTKNPRVQAPALAYEPGGRKFESCRAHQTRSFRTS